jgi:calcineurin-like phosphoesterase family protein
MEYFTADLHLGHANILKHDKRPFKDVNKMERVFISNINKTIRDPKHDILYILGDLSFRIKDINHIDLFINNIKCKRKILIIGNHDPFRYSQYIYAGFESVHSSLFIKNEEYCLVHDPCVASGYNDIRFICGHVHKLFKKLNNVVNVGCCIWDYKPVPFSDIEELFDDDKNLIL